MDDESNDVSRNEDPFDEERLSDLFRAQVAFKEELSADSTWRVDLVDGEFCRNPCQMDKVREDQVQNSAGGYVFKVSDETRVRRFMILGTSSGSYYENAKKLTLDNVADICKIIRDGNGFMVLKELAEINRDNRNPKMSPMLFVLALCARFHVHDPTKKADNLLIEKYSKYINELQKAAFDLVPEVCRIPTHLFEFVNYCEIISESTNVGSKTSSGWGRLMRRTITNWYGSKSVEKLALFLTKYPRREGWSHRDLFRLAHPNLEKIYKGDWNTRADRLELEQIYHFAAKGELQLGKRKMLREGRQDEKEVGKYTEEQMEKEAKSKSLRMIAAYLSIKYETRNDIIARAITKYGLVREHLPTDSLNSRLVWEALIGVNMPMTAMIRNLGKMTLVGALDEERIENLCARLTNEEELKKARIHPMTLLTARAIYSSGHGDKGSLEWKPDQRIVQALETGFYKSFCNAEPTNKRYCLALDVSGSMESRVSSSPLSCRDAASAMSLINLHNESMVKCVAFCDELTPLPFTKEWDIGRMNKYIEKLKFGATDCSLPMLWAAKKKLHFDVFIIYTDCETWVGNVHPFEAIKKYRLKSGIKDAKVIIMGMQASKFTIADPTDKGMLDVAGLDSAVPQIVHEFVTGQI